MVAVSQALSPESNPDFINRTGTDNKIIYGVDPLFYVAF